MQLLDFYRSRFGSAAKRQGNGWNGPCPLCGGEPGRSDRFVVWPDRSERLGQICAQNRITGVWSCRRCGASGDSIAYLVKCEGMTFKTALSELGIKTDKTVIRRKKAPKEPQKTAIWSPKFLAQPSAIWQEQAQKLVEKAEHSIWDNNQALEWLLARGIDESAILKYRIGYLFAESEKYQGRFRPRSAFGLPPKTDKNGRKRDKLFIPRGIVIPTVSGSGAILNIRVRRHKADLGEKSPKYLELEGSCPCPMFLESISSRPLATYFVTEAELDAMLIHHVGGGLIGAVAVRTNRGKPDSGCHSILAKSARICVSLDYDEAGAAGCDFWESAYPQSVRWPVPEGKDPGEAFALGVNIREWIAASLPACSALPNEESAHNMAKIQVISQNGQTDTLASGRKNLGKGESEKGIFLSEARTRLRERAMAADYNMENARWKTTQSALLWASEADFAPSELESLKNNIPAQTMLEDIYLDVAAIWLEWRNIPASLIIRRDESGALVGFRWECDYDWKAKNRERFDLFWRLQYSSRAFWIWVADHPAKRITADNLLALWDLLAKKYE